MKALLYGVFICFLSMILYGCESEDEDLIPPIPDGPLAVIEIGEDYYPDDTRAVIFLSKDSGELIEAFEAQNGDYIEIERPDDFTEERFSFTLFQASGDPFNEEYQSYAVQTWRGVRQGFSRKLIRDRKPLGQAVMNFYNVPDHTGYLISTPFSSSSGIGMPDRRTATIYGPEDCKGLVRLETADGPAYKIIEKMEAGTNIHCDFEQIEMQTDFMEEIMIIPLDDYGYIELQLDTYSQENNFDSYRYRVEDIFDGNPEPNLRQLSYAYPQSFLNNNTFNLNIQLGNKLGEGHSMNFFGNILPATFEVLGADAQLISVETSDFRVNINAMDPYDIMSSIWTFFRPGGPDPSNCLLFCFFSSNGQLILFS